MSSVTRSTRSISAVIAAIPARDRQEFNWETCLAPGATKTAAPLLLGGQPLSSSKTRSSVRYQYVDITVGNRSALFSEVIVPAAAPGEIASIPEELTRVPRAIGSVKDLTNAHAFMTHGVARVATVHSIGGKTIHSSGLPMVIPH